MTLVSFTDDDASITLEHFFTGRDDATLWNVSFMSRPAEWHAVVLGILAHVAPGVFGSLGAPEAVVAMTGVGGAVTYFAGRANKQEAVRKAEGLNLHWRDALREPAYFAGGYLGTALVLDFQGTVNTILGVLPGLTP